MQFLKMLRQMLERAGHVVLEAPDGNIGAKLFRKERPDLIITDIFMPKKEGIEIITELKRKVPTVKIIAISGGGRANNFDFLEIAEILGADRSFSKPFGRQELLKAIQELVNQ